MYQKENIDIKVDDFPREIDDRNKKLDKFEKIRNLIKLKEDIIWNLIIDKKERLSQEEILCREKYQNEIFELKK